MEVTLRSVEVGVARCSDAAAACVGAFWQRAKVRHSGMAWQLAARAEWDFSWLSETRAHDCASFIARRVKLEALAG